MTAIISAGDLRPSKLVVNTLVVYLCTIILFGTKISLSSYLSKHFLCLGKNILEG